MDEAEPLKVGDRVEVFAVYPDKLISRGQGVITGSLRSLYFVKREGAHPLAGTTNKAPYNNYIVKIEEV